METKLFLDKVQIRPIKPDLDLNSTNVMFDKRQESVVRYTYTFFIYLYFLRFINCACEIPDF